MAPIKISSKVDAAVWEELRALAAESRQNISGLLTDAIREYVHRRRVRPVVLEALDASMTENEKLGRLLAE
jgi:predicted transcriptional regulator